MKVFKRIMIFGIAIPVIVYFSLIAVVQLYSYFSGADLHEPAVLHQTPYAFRTNDDIVYFAENYTLQRYDYKSDNHYRTKVLKKDNIELNFYGFYCGEKFIVVHGAIQSHSHDYLWIFDYDFTFINEIVVDDLAAWDFLVYDESIYYFAHPFSNNSDAEKPCIVELNILTKEKRTVAEKILFDTAYFDGNNALEVGHQLKFVNHLSQGRKTLSNWYDNTGKKSIVHKHCLEADLHVESDNIFVKEDNQEFVLKINDTSLSLYDNAYKINDVILFAVVDKVNNKECNTYEMECICNYGESYLISFDLKTNKFNIINTFKKGTFLIDYDLEGYRYYYDGGLYVDDCFFKECEKITPGVIKRINGGGNYPMGKEKLVYYLSYYDGVFYGI